MYQPDALPKPARLATSKLQAAVHPFMAAAVLAPPIDSVAREPDRLTKWQIANGTSTQESNLAILREERFKLVHFNSGMPPLLFNLETDPDELHDLAGDPAHAGTLLRLTQKLLSHRITHTDRSLTDVKLTRVGAIGSKP